MPTVIELKDRALKEIEEARVIKDTADAQNRGMTSEEASQFDTHMDAAERIGREAERQERLEKAETAAAEAKAPESRVQVVTPKLEYSQRETKPIRMGTLVAFKGEHAEERAYRCGQWVRATLFNNAQARQWCHDRGIELRVQTEGVNAAGGYLVPQEFEQTIIDLREQYGDFRKNCQVVPMASDNMVIPRRAGGVTAYFVGETGAITESDAAWSQVSLSAKKVGALTRMSTDLSDDAVISIADWLANEMAYAFAAKEDTCGIDGDGTSTYGGIVGIRTKMIDGAHAGSYYEAAAAGDNWSELDEADFAAMVAALPKYAEANAKWYISKAGWALSMDRLARAKGGVTRAETEQGSQLMFMGYPVVTMTAMPSDDSGAALDATIMCFFGDLRQAAALGDRRGITVKVSADRYMEYDQIGIQATERFDINVHDIGGASGVRGPVVGLLGNSA